MACLLPRDRHTQDRPNPLTLGHVAWRTARPVQPLLTIHQLDLVLDANGPCNKELTCFAQNPIWTEVQMRTRIMNQLQALAMNEGYRWKEKLFSEQGRAQLEKLALAPWASRRRQELLELLDRMNPTIEELTAAVEREARKRPDVIRLMTHPGVGPLTALAYVLISELGSGSTAASRSARTWG